MGARSDEASLNQPEQNPKESGRAIATGLTAYLLWGVLPLYLIWLIEVQATEVLTHRIIWAIPFGALIITIRRQWPEVKRALTHKTMFLLLVTSSAMITVNWLLYIWAVQNAQVFQASLGYYINPLIFILVGMLFFGERLTGLQQLAVGLAFTGVAVLTISGGQFPWISLTLAVSFTIYSVIRKKVVVGAMPGLFVEVLLLLPFALAWLLYLGSKGEAMFFGGDPGMISLLILGGPITVVPLLCFAIAARQLRMATIGFMQFLAPTLQFLIGVWHGEELTTPHLVCFIFIWAAVIAFSSNALRAGRLPKPA